MPLLRVSDLLLDAAVTRAPNATSRRPLQVVVYSEKGRSVGLVVDRILDIVERRSCRTAFEARRVARFGG